MERQDTDWGYIDWLEINKKEKKSVLRVGIVVINAHAHMPSHIHFDEQIIYTFQGNGYSLINGQRINMNSSENNLLHWMPGVIHEMYNLGDEPYIHLMVTCSDLLVENDTLPERQNHNNISIQESIRCLYEVIEETRDSFLNTLRYSFVIYDVLGNVAAASKLFPKYCKEYCADKLHHHSAFCMQKKYYPVSETEDTFLCPGGLTVLSVPIVFQENIIGYVEGGYVYTGDQHRDLTEENTIDHELYMAPISSVENVWILLKRMARMLSNYCELNWYRTDIEKQEYKLNDERRDRELLEADLKKTESSMIDLKINNHFLFNTLNQMAAMALEGGVIPLYQSIVDLSKMFQYTLRQDRPMVTLEQELDYLDAYLKLQKLRYGDRLMVKYEINVSAEKWWVPFNWMMPVAENAFTHGFKDAKIKNLSISAKEETGWLEINIQNNGVILDESTLKVLRIRMRGAEVHGMPMIYQKMKSCYGDQFIMDIQAVEDGTSVTIMLPDQSQPCERSGGQ